MTKEKGSPSKANEIAKAIDGLMAHGVDLTNMERPKARALIRTFASEKLNANVAIGYSDPVIQRALFLRFGKRC